MIEFKIRQRVASVGRRKGQKVYYLMPKETRRLSKQAVVERIVRETSLTAGDVSNAIISLATVVCDALREGWSVDLGELGNLRLSVPSRRMDSPDELSVQDALKSPRILFKPKRAMREAARQAKFRIDHSSMEQAGTEDSGT